MRMQAVHEVNRGMSLNRALRYCGMSKRAWYYTAEYNFVNNCQI